MPAPIRGSIANYGRVNCEWRDNIQVSDASAARLRMRSLHSRERNKGHEVMDESLSMGVLIDVLPRLLPDCSPF